MYYDSQIYEGQDQEEEKEEDPDQNKDYDSEEEEKPKLSKENTKDMFANFFTQASSNYDQQAEDEKKAKKQKYLEEKKRLEAI